VQHFSPDDNPSTSPSSNGSPGSPGPGGVSRRPEPVALADLRPGASPRLQGEDEAHARLLAAAPGELPPILVHRPTMRVIDGMHRVTAASLRGHRHILALFFDGLWDDAFVEAVRRNVTHGKPLTQQERERAAERILTTHPQWSDRVVAEACGMSPRTVARLRRVVRPARSTVVRVGRDGRARPTDTTAGRLQAAEIMRERPEASLREVAELAGTSVGTARDVRHRLTSGRHPLPDRARALREPAAYDWSQDRAVAVSACGDRFASWFQASAIERASWVRFVDVLPLSRLYLVSDESRRRAREWSAFAGALDERVRREKSS
jgi:hypothetical protein